MSKILKQVKSQVNKQKLKQHRTMIKRTIARANS